MRHVVEEEDTTCSAAAHQTADGLQRKELQQAAAATARHAVVMSMANHTELEVLLN
jgi:hypothetical protein